MVAVTDAKERVKAWAEKNLIRRIPGEGKRAVAAVIAGRVIDNAERVLDGLGGTAAGRVLAGSGILADGMLDETVLDEVREKLGAGKIEFSVPLVGTFSLDGDAVDSLRAALAGG